MRKIPSDSFPTKLIGQISKVNISKNLIIQDEHPHGRYFSQICVYRSKFKKKRFLFFFVLKPIHPIFNFTKNTDREDLRTDLSFFLVCLDPHNDLPILSEII